MTRHELYKAMEQEKIIMYDTFFARLERTPLPELMTRWIGILILDREYRIGTHRAEWLATVMWNSAALTVGEAELARRESERQKETERQAKVEQLRKTIKADRELARQKLAFWHLCSKVDHRRLVENFLPACDEFYQGYVRKKFLNDLENMPDRTVLLWFWQAIPPFSLKEEPSRKISLDSLAA